MHIPLPRLRPHHEPYALERGVEDALVEFGRYGDIVEGIVVPFVESVFVVMAAVVVINNVCGGGGYGAEVVYLGDRRDNVLGA